MAEISKIHTIEWTTQLLYDEPLHIAMNANWSGLFAAAPVASQVTKNIVAALRKSPRAKEASKFYSAFAAGSGIVGLGNSRRLLPDFLPEWLSPDLWSVSNPGDINGGINHFGSPFNFSEEFVSVYRLHPMVPDILEYRDIKDPNQIQKKIPVIDTFRGKATAAMREGGLAKLGIEHGPSAPRVACVAKPPVVSTKPRSPASYRRQNRRGCPRHHTRPRTRLPRFNEFRRQIGLRQLSGSGDFIDVSLPEESSAAR